MATKSKQFKFQFEGIEKDVLCEIIDKKLWCYVEQETFCYDISDLSSTFESSSRSKTNSKPIHLIKAPMPGKITKIFVKEGEMIEKAQPLLVMEAMKMEYTLKSDLNTVVEKINVQVSEQVILGQLLIQLQSSSIKL